MPLSKTGLRIPVPKSPVKAALGLIIAVNVFLCAQFTAAHFHEPWPHRALEIDAGSYLRGADELQRVPFWRMSDIYHSPGFQAFLAALQWVSGSGLVTALKLVLLALFAAAVALTYRLGRRVAGAQIGLAAAAIFSCSLSWRWYASMVQYEVLTGFLLLAFLLITLRDRKGIAPDALGGLLLAAVIWIQSRYLLLLAIPLALFIRPRDAGERRGSACLFLFALAPVLAWVLARSLQAGAFVPLMDGADRRFRIGNSPFATGAAFPYAPVGEPSGWAFVWQRPGNFLWLVGQRFQYLFGLKRDVWSIPPWGTGYEDWSPWVSAVALLFFLAGLLLFARREPLRRNLPVFLLLASVILPPLFVFASERFLIPVFPVIAVFQAYAVVSAARRVSGTFW